MSSNTQVDVTPVPPRPTVYEVTAQQALAVDRVLGNGGAALLRDTLAYLATSRGELDPEVVARLDWRPVSGRPDCYQTTIASLSVQLDLSAGYALLSYAEQISTFGAPPAQLHPDHQRAANQKVNQLLAFALTRRVSQALKQHAGTQLRVQQSVKVNVTNAQRFTLRTSAYVSR